MGARVVAWHAEAHRLRAEGLTIHQVCDRLDKSMGSVCHALYHSASVFGPASGLSHEPEVLAAYRRRRHHERERQAVQREVPHNGMLMTRAELSRPPQFGTIDRIEVMRLHKRGLGVTQIAALLRAPYRGVSEVIGATPTDTGV